MKIRFQNLANIILCFVILGVSSCSSVFNPRSFTDSKRLDIGCYMNGRNTILGSDYAFLAIKGFDDMGVVLIEFDSKPFFIESRIAENNRRVSPMGLSDWSPDLVIPPGPHSLTLKYEKEPLSTSLFPSPTERIGGETKVQFIAEKGHTYLIKANVTVDEKTRVKSWHPEIEDVPPRQSPQ